MTGQELFDTTSRLIGECLEEGENWDVIGFRCSAVQMINVLICELDWLDCQLKKTDPDSDEHSIPVIENLSDTIDLHDLITVSLLPLGLGYMFLSEENPVRAAFFYKKYEAQLGDLKKRFVRGKRHSVRDVYSAD